MAKLASAEKKKKAADGLSVNQYYIDIADRIGKIKWICSGLLLLAVIVSIVLGRSDLSFYNFQYLLKHFAVNSADDTSNFRELNYDSDGNYVFGYYKNDLVVVSKRGIDFYDMRGNSVLNGTHTLSKPQIVETDQYLYVYDQGFHTYSVYNSFACLKSVTTEYPIYKIAGSGSGVFALLTKSNNYKGVVSIYDKNFRTLSEVFKDKYIIDINVASDGSRVLLLSCDTNQEGEFFTEVQSVIPGKEEAELTVMIPDCFPLRAAYFSNGNIGVLCTGRFLTYNKQGTLISEIEFAGHETPTCDFADHYAALSFKKNAMGVESLVKVIDENGEETGGDIEVQGEIKKLSCEPTAVFALLTDAVARIDYRSGTVAYETVQGNPLDFIVRDEESFLICYNNKTQSVYYAFSDDYREDQNNDNNGNSD
ncbi:MAG: hypothetical protein HFE78_02755 [Clostridiales bacterium]|nr:hypothetical protein [Clostridiales bacterium]